MKEEPTMITRWIVEEKEEKKTIERTLQSFVEDMLSDGKTANHIIITAKNTRWKSRIDEVKQEIQKFSGILEKRFTILSEKSQ